MRCNLGRSTKLQGNPINQEVPRYWPRKLPLRPDDSVARLSKIKLSNLKKYW